MFLCSLFKKEKYVFDGIYVIRYEILGKQYGGLGLVHCWVARISNTTFLLHLREKEDLGIMVKIDFLFFTCPSATK